MGKPKNDLTNQTFGQLTVVKYIGNSSWECLCSCGKTTTTKTNNLTSGHTKSCGCLRGKHTKNHTRKSKPKQDLTGLHFGSLTPMYYVKGGKWHCKCECGNERDVDTRNLNSGHTTSCGCQKGKKISQALTIDMNGYEDENLKVLQRDGSTPRGIVKWKCLCKHCGREFTTKGANIRSKETQSCGCVHSYNERQITKMLLDNNIEFAAQYTFPDLMGMDNIHPLRFDFAIFANGQLKHLIEYNGEQHYKRPQGKWGEQYDILIQNDQKKINYCKKHNIELRIIKYTDTYTLEDLI